MTTSLQGRLAFPGRRAILVRRDDGRWLLAPALAAAAGGRGRSALRLLPPWPGRPLSARFEGRWLVVETEAGAGLLELRVPPKSDRCASQAIAAAAPVPAPSLGTARIGREAGVLSLEERELSFLGEDGGRRRCALPAAPDAVARCPEAPWLALLTGSRLELRELGPRWGRRIGRWSLAAP